MGVKDTSFSEEVTKHSVHTLVFRSLKRTHDMFVSDQVGRLISFIDFNLVSEKKILRKFFL
jgi:hypothetical protein